MVFLDFDGVLFNTVREAYAVAMISTEKFDTIKSINFNSDHYIRFERYRYLIGPAWNYKYILESLIYYNEDAIEKNYKLLIEKARVEDYESFEKSFFDTRRRLQDNSFQRWLELNTSYPFLHLIKELLIAKGENFLIVTTKDKDTVQRLLQLEDIDFSKKDIYDKCDFEKYKNKFNIINKLMTEKEITNAIFIDDSRKHLESCSGIKRLKLLQANWGYIGSKDFDTYSDVEIFKKILKEGAN